MTEVYDATAELVEEVPDASPETTYPVHDIPQTPVEAAPVKSRRKAVAKPERLPEDCYMEDPKKMTDKERIAVITMFQAQIEDFRRSYENLDKTAQSAFAQARGLRDENERIRRESRTKIGLLKQNIAMIYQNSILVSAETGE